MMKVETVELEGKEYAILSETIINDITYIHFVSTVDPIDFCIRKVVIKNGEEIITGLDSREEFEMALSQFSEKYRKDFDI